MKTSIAMRFYLCIILCLLFLQQVHGQTDTLQLHVAGRKNSPDQQKKPYVILISADGFRFDYAEKYNAKHLLKLSGNGVRAASLMPAFPSKTFPNHYSIVTGLYPSHHGLVDNSFYDPKINAFYSISDRRKVEDQNWYGGIPLWVLAEKEKMLSASFYWVGSEAPIQNVLPTYYYKYNEAISIGDRLKAVENWLNLPEETRPHLITFYLPEVDHAGHSYGPDAEETERAVMFVDSVVQQLSEIAVKSRLPVNFIFLADHGMTKVDTSQTLSLPLLIDTSKFVISKGDVMIKLYAKDKQYVLPLYNSLKKKENGFKVYLKSNFPSQLHYGDNDDTFSRIGDILILACWPKIFQLSKKGHISPGRHGYDPTKVKDMHAVFYAWGPGVKEGCSIPTLNTVDVYDIVAKLLGLEYSNVTDGNKKVANTILR